VAAQDGVDAAHAAGHLQVGVHAVVADDDDDLRALGPGLVDHLLHVLVLDAEFPVLDHVARVGDRRVGEGLADDGHRHAVHLLDDVGLEHRVAEVQRLDVLGHEVELAGEVLLDDFLHAVHAQRELPVAGHHVDAEQLAGIDHVLALGPQRRAAALPGVAAVQQQRAGAAGAHALDQRGQVRKAAHLAVALRDLLEVEVRQRVRLGRAGLHAGGLQQVLAHQVRQLALHVGHAEVHAGLAEVDGLELRVAVGDVQEGHVAEFGDVVQAFGGRLGAGVGKVAQAHAGGAGGAEHLQEFAFGEVHISTY